jgi:hypothetical protein
VKNEGNLTCPNGGLIFLAFLQPTLSTKLRKHFNANNSDKSKLLLSLFSGISITKIYSNIALKEIRIVFAAF